MQLFKNILVGIDLQQCGSLKFAALNNVVREPIHWGIKLAKANSAQLTFFSATNVSEEALRSLDNGDSELSDTLLRAGNKLLGEVVQDAREHGVQADSKVVHGKGWLEIIRQVGRARHDLVIVGTRGVTSLGRMLFGNTGMKLLRRCPCPVLVTKVGSHNIPINMLIAASVEPPSDDSLQMGIALAHQTDGKVHILHVVEHLLDRVCHIGLPDARQEEYRQKARMEADRKLHAMLDRTDYRTLGDRVEIHLSEKVGRPDQAIQHFIQLNDINLLAMGTMARHGLSGILIGNTAERLLPEVNCSVLAVKPADFVFSGED